MFAEDGVFEMPYLESLDIPWRYAGRKEVEGFFKFVRGLYPDMEFHGLKVVCETQMWRLESMSSPRRRARPDGSSINFSWGVSRPSLERSRFFGSR